jgi:uncharacterized protein YjdB
MRTTSPFRRTALALALGAGLALSACDSTTEVEPPTLTGITVSPPTATLAIGATQALTVTGQFSDGTNSALTTGVTFATSQASVASVSTAGVVTAVSGGSATITATSGGRNATSTITVTPAAPTLSSIALTPATISLQVGATQALTVTGTFSDATTSTLTSGVTFASSASGVATVSAAGLITAVSAGTTTITATHTASTRTATRLVTVTAAPTPATGAEVFLGAYSSGVAFEGFDGAANDVSIDATTQHNGRSSIKAVITATGGYSGGAFVAATPRNLSAYNALTFWARSNVPRATLNVGVGNAVTTAGLNAESLDISLTTTFQKFIIPLPDRAKMVDVRGLFHFADGPTNYTVWFADVQYELLPASEVAAPTQATVNWPTITTGIGSSVQMASAPNVVRFTTPVLPNGGALTDVGWRWFTLTSSNPAVATVDADGRVTGVSAGSATITATLGGLTVAGSAAVTVTAPLAVPTTIAPAPTRAAADVISLFTTAYPNRPVETWRTSWSAGNSELVDPFNVAGRAIKRYSLFNFVGVEFGIATPANAIDASGMTHVHFDLWSPNPAASLQIELVHTPGPSAVIGRYQAGALAAGQWVSLDIPLASFTGLTSRSQLQQLLFVAGAPMVLYVDNIYFYK